MCLFVFVSKELFQEFFFDAGSNETIECEMSSQLSIKHWFFLWPGQGRGHPQSIYFFNGLKIKSDFADSFDVQPVNRSDHWASVVTLLNVRPHHAGLYACLDSIDVLPEYPSHIINIIRE